MKIKSDKEKSRGIRVEEKLLCAFNLFKTRYNLPFLSLVVEISEKGVIWVKPKVGNAGRSEFMKSWPDKF